MCVVACHCIDTVYYTVYSSSSSYMADHFSSGGVLSSTKQTLNIGGVLSSTKQTLNIVGTSLSQNVANVTTVDYDSEAVASLRVMHHLTPPLTSRCLIINKAT